MNLSRYNDVPGFVLHALAEVSYDGRAYSTLAVGDYLIIKKADGSLMVHGAANVPPLNYMSGSKNVQVSGNTITATRRSETIIIKVHEVHHLFEVKLSANKIEIGRTEAELTDKLVANPQYYLGAGVYQAFREHHTSAGPVDLVLVSDCIYIIEVKRKKIALKDLYQVRRYLDAFEKRALAEKKAFGVCQDCKVIGCLAGPEISANAQIQCNEQGIRFIRVDWEEVP